MNLNARPGRRAAMVALQTSPFVATGLGAGRDDGRAPGSAAVPVPRLTVITAFLWQTLANFDGSVPEHQGATDGYDEYFLAGHAARLCR